LQLRLRLGLGINSKRKEKKVKRIVVFVSGMNEGGKRILPIYLCEYIF